LVAREQGGYGGFNDRMIDLRVDDAARPIDELARLLESYELLFLKLQPEDLLPIDAALASELQQALARSGDYQGPITGAYDEITFRALERYAGRENLEERLTHDQANARLDRKVLEYMRAHIK
jgi:uncharacterized Ntn-hydrolase superfamily protein